MLLPHVKSDIQSPWEEAEAPLGWLQGPLLWLVWGDADLSTPPPGRAKKRCQWHLLRESGVVANLIRQEVSSVRPGSLVIHINKGKWRVWNEGTKKRKLKTTAAISYVICYLSLVTRASTPSGPNLLFPFFPYSAFLFTFSEATIFFFFFFFFLFFFPQGSQVIFLTRYFLTWKNQIDKQFPVTQKDLNNQARHKTKDLNGYSFNQSYLSLSVRCWPFQGTDPNSL